MSAYSFISVDFLAPFLDSCTTTIENYLESLRGRFSTNILRGTAGTELQKRYPLSEPGREIQIRVPFRNTGPGMAVDLRVTATATSEEVVVGGSTLILGNVLPGDFSVSLDAMIISEITSFQLLVSLEWAEIGNPSNRSEVFEFDVVAQTNETNWDSLEYSVPYSTNVAEGEQFLGRQDKIRTLSARLLRTPMESFYLTGQKRVGKTSLALAAADFAERKSSGNRQIHHHYVLWGQVAHAEPIVSVRLLGERLERFILGKIETNGRFPNGDYNGSLSPLIEFSDWVYQISPNLKFVFILDEFDEIHQDLFLQGNLAETFFANLRALSRCKNICIILIGGENMPYIMDRQGQKLNNFSRINLSYYSRSEEWDDFQLLVRKPTEDSLRWHEDAVVEVFNITNGNPYFTNIVCSSVFRSAVSGRDADITAEEVKRALDAEVSALGANSFAHLWQDGVPKSAHEREPDILRRMRVLVAFARCLRKGSAASVANIVQHRTSGSLSEGEISLVLNDFSRREVLYEDDKQFFFRLPIFELWLVDVGVSQLIADSLSEELANVALSMENAAIVRSDEIVGLTRHWPTYRGRHIGTDDVKAWLEQVDSHRDQRLLFELLKRLRIFSETQVRERLKTAHSFLRRELPEFVIRKKSDRRSDVLITYIDGEGKSGANYASLYAEENGIAADCVVGKTGFRARYNAAKAQGNVSAVIVIDDIAATGKTLEGNISVFIDDFKAVLKYTKTRIITLVATEAAQTRISEAIARTQNLDIEFRTCEILSQDGMAVPADGSNWKSSEDFERARALCINLGSRIYKDNPLGYGDLGLLVVFPTTVPNNSLPILHSYSRTGSAHKWEPLFPRVTN